MANGGWYGTEEEWRQAEEPLVRLDLRMEQFAAQHGFTLSRNHKDWPDRSLRKEAPLSCMIQIWRGRLEADEWKVWAVCSEDRGQERFWKRALLADNVPAEQLGASLEALLAQGLAHITRWSADPGSLEFATKLQPLD